ncbi:hypothetical protein F5J12DRAFT_786786 [Pisolithus orientalis]|uniref:uncharacterized protein n=1 Tax=Pisolithus orientalis TaxID=936130 RepID=UPI00222581D5|nr:uncharacterized protein F5J12DRAFT_786786 [Pisolithus orientalis]KAI5988849.1 hypothetical protein F5J12DRAFT_786786 [Pisolithus orientalis]
MVCQFHHTKLLKRAGRASKQDGIHTTIPDANFQLKNCAHASDQDPGLHTGLAYFVANGPYNEHILWFAMQEDVHLHDYAFVPNMNLYALVVWAICKKASTISPFQLLSMVISYDIACQWKLNLAQRIDQLPKHLCLPLAIITSSFVFSIPKFHAPAHSASCAIPHSLNLLPGVGCTDGEGVKCNWSEINCVTNSTKEMTSSVRHDTINDHFSHHNFRKLVGLNVIAVPTKAEVHSRLAADDKAAAACGEFSHHKMSPSSFVSFGLTIEETQYFCKIQVVYMIGIESIVQQSEDPEAEAKAIHLCMPSELSPTECMSISDDISVIKVQLREVQYSFHQILKHKHLWPKGKYSHKDTDKHTLLKDWQSHTEVPGSWEEELQPLQMKDVCGLTASTLGDIDDPNAIIGSNGCQRSKKQHKALRHGLGEGYRTMSWIWACGTVASSDEGMIEEWAKAHVQAAHWSEEVELLLEEMWHTEKFLKYKAQWWKQCREPPSGVMVDSLIDRPLCNTSSLIILACFGIEQGPTLSVYELGDSDLEDNNLNSSAYEVGDNDLNGSVYEVGDNDLEDDRTDEDQYLQLEDCPAISKCLNLQTLVTRDLNTEVIFFKDLFTCDITMDGEVELYLIWGDGGMILFIQEARTNMSHDEIPITFLPLPPLWNPMDANHWLELSMGIEWWLVDIVQVMNVPEWTWGHDMFWLAYIGAYPAFPCRKWEPWNPIIPLEGQFIKEWLAKEETEDMFPHNTCCPFLPLPFAKMSALFLEVTSGVTVSDIGVIAMCSGYPTYMSCMPIVYPWPYQAVIHSLPGLALPWMFQHTPDSCATHNMGDSFQGSWVLQIWQLDM